jgi:CHRD domain
MRISILAVPALLVGLSLAGSATPASAHTPGHSDDSGTATSHSATMPDMAGMNMAPGAPMTVKPGLTSDIDRAKLRPLFLKAELNGHNEVPVAGKPAVGDPDGSATGFVRVQGNRVTFAFSWKGIGTPTLGHIHQGDAGVNGDVKVPLFATAMPDGVTQAAGAITVSDPAIADAIRANPAGFYLNLHTAEFPGGAVRGQLGRLTDPTDLLSLLQGGGEKAFMSGDQEVPVAGGPAVGDPTARAVAFIRPRGYTVDYSFAWVGLAPTLGHIHKGVFGTNGPVVVPLFGSPVPSTVFAVSGTVANLDPALVKDISEHPSAFYTNLHSAQFPGGSVRGQLCKLG